MPKPWLLIAIPALAAGLQAQDPGMPDGRPGDGWSATGGLMAMTAPAYAGSDQQQNRFFPLVKIDYGRFSLGTNPAVFGMGISMCALRKESFKWDIGLGWQEGRLERRADALAGMGNEKGSTFVGSAFSYRLGFFKLGLSLGHALSLEAGNLCKVNLGTFIPISPKVMAGFSATIGFADTRAMRYGFGLDPGQAERRQALIDGGDPRLQAGEGRGYQPTGGLRDATLGANVMFRLTKTWNVMAMLNDTHLLGRTLDSPLVRKKENILGGIGIGYHF